MTADRLYSYRYTKQPFRKRFLVHMGQGALSRLGRFFWLRRTLRNLIFGILGDSIVIKLIAQFRLAGFCEELHPTRYRIFGWSKSRSRGTHRREPLKNETGKSCFVLRGRIAKSLSRVRGNLKQSSPYFLDVVWKVSGDEKHHTRQRGVAYRLARQEASAEDGEIGLKTLFPSGG